MSSEPADDPLPAEGRVTLLLTSPRGAPGLLSWAGWQRLRAADAVLAADPDPAWLNALDEAGVQVQDVADLPTGRRAGRLVQDAADGRELVWWGSPDGDPGLTDALAEHLSRRAVAGRPPQVEVLTAAHDVPGARLLDLVDVMDTLRSPGGCPWDAEQTHVSLLPYLLEETHEVIEAVEAGDRDHLVEELGDLLLQVVFHARVAQEDAHAPFDIDDVAGGIVAKLVRRHPHVFGVGQSDELADEQDGAWAAEVTGEGAEAVIDAAGGERSWEQLKAIEKPNRALYQGIPGTLPALARAQKMFDRLNRAPHAPDPEQVVEVSAAGDEVVAQLLRAVLAARESGVDAEAGLRAALARFPQP